MSEKGNSCINFTAMVTALAKPGEKIQMELTPMDCHLLHMAIGIAGEAGEIIDAIKKPAIYRKPYDRQHIIEELGDLEFYMEGLRQGMGITRKEVIDYNIDKLGKRYADGQYSNKQATERADKE